MRTLCEVDVDCRPLLASGGRDGVVRLWDLENRGARMASLTGRRGWVYGLCTVRSSGRGLLASAGRDGAIHIWNPRDGRLVRTIDGCRPRSTCPRGTSRGCTHRN
ncbi:WD40 repeat domain-containing protein [Streptomyces sp. NBC_00444]|uniref:WD40 repeat domain-containing protein n=1 Tax=unclassified Streptomyces TaxID=2593676 RepID=UPI003FA749A0